MHWASGSRDCKFVYEEEEEKATRAFQPSCITRQPDAHRFVCFELASLTLGVSGHKYAPRLEEMKV